MNRSYFRVLWMMVLTAMIAIACSDSTSPPEAPPAPKPVVYELMATDDAGINVSVKANQRVEITTTDSVSTNPNILVPDCDKWTKANGIADCHYVTTEQECRGLPFMALLGNVDNDYFVVGTDFDSTFANDVQLKLVINDWVFFDNAGKFTISVLLK